MSTKPNIVASQDRGNEGKTGPVCLGHSIAHLSSFSSGASSVLTTFLAAMTNKKQLKEGLVLSYCPKVLSVEEKVR